MWGKETRTAKHKHKNKQKPWSHVTDLANSFYLHRNVYTYFLCTQKILSIYTYMVLTYFTTNSMLILFLDENKKMSQNVSHQSQNYEKPGELRTKISSLYYHTLSLVYFLQRTKPNTVRISAVKGKECRCKIESWAVGFLNNVVREILLVRTVFFSFSPQLNVLLSLIFYRQAGGKSQHLL